MQSVDRARAHEARGRPVGDHGDRDPRARQFPRGEPATLEERARLIDEDMDAAPRFVREIDGGERRADTTRGQGAGVAVCENARSLGNEGKRMFADAPAHGAILLEQRRGFGAQSIEDVVRIAGHCASAFEHSVERARQIDRRRPGGANALGVRVQAGVELSARLIHERQQRRNEAHRTRNADRRRAANRETSDGIADVVDRLKVALDEATRQLSLVDNAYGVAIRRPAYGLDDGHGQGT